MSMNYIKRFVFALPTNRIFTTREVLIYGSRNIVDQSLWRLVKAGIIVRLARGVFIKDGSDRPTAFEVAKAKYQSFGKQIVEHGFDLAKKLELINKNNEQITFATNGHTSQFWFGNILIRIKGICLRKMLLNKNKAGQAIASLWYLGQEVCQPSHIEKANRWFRRHDIEQRRLLFFANAYMVGQLFQ